MSKNTIPQSSVSMKASVCTRMEPRSVFSRRSLVDLADRLEDSFEFTRYVGRPRNPSTRSTRSKASSKRECHLEDILIAALDLADSVSSDLNYVEEEDGDETNKKEASKPVVKEAERRGA